MADTKKQREDSAEESAPADETATATLPSDESREEAEAKGKLSLEGDGASAPVAPSPPGFERGMRWSSDDARRAYESEGSTLEEQQRLGAEGQPPGSE